ncbi:MAG: hypothetical protein M3Z08_09470 [Chloroflexota bacterium]|nr:hypothetical protein [Chloroflexota bacterium]
MSTEETAPDPQISSSSLHNKPPRPQQGSRRSFSWLFYLLGGVVLLGGLGLVVWQILPPANRGSADHGNTVVPNKNRPIDFPPGTQGDRPVYWQTIQQDIAQHLHLSIEALRTKLSTPQPAGGTHAASSTPTPSLDTNGKSATQPAKTGGSSDASMPRMSDVALEQGISAEQLQIIEINAIQHGFDKLVNQGLVTQNYVNQWLQQVRGWTMDTFNKYMTLVFKAH